MSQHSAKDEINKAIREKFIIIANLILDCILILIWVLAAWAIKKYAIPFLDDKDFDKHLLNIFQWISGITTLGVLVVYIIRDLLIIGLRVLAEIKEEIEKYAGKKTP